MPDLARYENTDIGGIYLLMNELLFKMWEVEYGRDQPLAIIKQKMNACRGVLGRIIYDLEDYDMVKAVRGEVEQEIKRLHAAHSHDAAWVLQIARLSTAMDGMQNRLDHIGRDWEGQFTHAFVTAANGMRSATCVGDLEIIVEGLHKFRTREEQMEGI